MESVSIAFDPALPLGLITALGAAAAAAVGLALWRGLPGWWLRAAAAALLVLALAGPELKREEREGLASIGFLVVDRSDSTGLEDRAEVIAEAAERLAAQAAALSTPEAPFELRVVEAAPERGIADGGTRLLTALDEAAARVAPGQIAGAVLLSDGQIHDAGRIEAFPAPVHALIAGREDAFDLRLALVNAPGFGIVGQRADLRVRAEALGPRPQSLGAEVVADLSIDGGPPRPVRLPIGTETIVEIDITHGGPTVVDLNLPVRPDELTDRNNRVIAEINGVRDRLRVLLVSGEPHPGGRAWRDLLKSDPTVDLIHFTILRPPAKQDGTPVGELSLIAFPTRELFLEKIDGFDLIVFDRYRERGVLATAYLENIVRYVQDGGAVLLSSGPAFAGAQSLARTPLGRVLPAEPTLNVIERPFLPRVTDVGRRHPVTAGLEEAAGVGPDGPRWGRWLRQIEMTPSGGTVVMEGADQLPLVMLDRVGEGRVALVASDHSWLWSRGYEGGGPEADLLRRTAHWLMQEPELEEEALFAGVQGDRVTIERRTLAETPPAAVLATPPDGGERLELALEPAGPGRFQAVLEEAALGLWRFEDQPAPGLVPLSAVAAVGPASPREYENPLATAALLAPLADATGGRIVWAEADGVPDLRLVEEGRRASGARWLGMVQRDAYRVAGVSLTPLMPGWAATLAIAALLVGAWRREGR